MLGHGVGAGAGAKPRFGVGIVLYNTVTEVPYLTSLSVPVRCNVSGQLCCGWGGRCNTPKATTTRYCTTIGR